MTGMRIWAAQLSVILAVVWLALDGLDGWVFGALAAAAGAAFGTAFAPGEPPRWRPLRLAIFLGFFIGESVRGGLDVAWRALRPSLPVAPSFGSHRTALPPGQPLTLFVSALSLLPGTLSAGLDEASGTVDIHFLTPSAHASVARLERQVARLYSLA